MDLQQLIDATPDGDVVDGGGRTFASEATVRITGRHHLALRNFKLTAVTDGAGAPAWSPPSWPRNRSHLRVDGGSTHITFDNVEVVGPNAAGGTSSGAYVPALEAQHAFDVDEGSSFVTIRNCRASYVYGDLAYIRGNDVLVEGCTFTNSGRQGIAITAALRVVVRGNTLDQIRRSHVDIETNLAWQQCRDITITGNLFKAARLLGVACKGAGSNISHITIDGNTFLGHMGTPTISFDTPVGHKRGPITVTNNWIRTGGSSAPGVEFKRIEGVTFAGNQLSAPADRKMTAIALVGCPWALITPDNTFAGYVTAVRATL
jgi:Right handed beta helix region